MRILFCWMMVAGVAFAEDASVGTNDVKAVEAISTVEGDESAEAEEVAEIAQRVGEKEAEKMPEDIDPWDVFVPPADSEFDWIQLTSGEWLKGDFKVLYDYTLEFDSDELDLLEFDFDDVRRVRTRGMKTLFVEGDDGPRDTSILRGVLEIKGDEVVLRRRDYEVEIPRDRVISIASGRQRERDYWSGMASIGVNMRAGNADTTDTTIMATLKRRTAATRFNADYLANYSQAEDVETANNQRLSGYFDKFLTGRFYWQVLAGEYYRDPFTNIDGQYSVSMGAGLDLVHNSRTDWGINVGGGYQEQRFVSVEEGEDESSSSPFLTAGMRYDRELTKTVDYLFDYSLRWLNESNGQYTHHLLTTLSMDLVKDFDLDVSLVWDHIRKPQADDTGAVPEQDDFQLIVSLAYEF